MWNTIGVVSSIVTLVMFLIFIIGKIIIVVNSRKIESVKVDFSENIMNKKNYKIKDEINLIESKVDKREIIITPVNQYFKWIEVYDVDIETSKLKRIKRIKIKDVMIGQSILIHCNIPCAVCKNVLRFKREDNMIGSIPLSDNYKNGIQEELVVMNHNILSILYYIFK